MFYGIDWYFSVAVTSYTCRIHQEVVMTRTATVVMWLTQILQILLYR